MYFSGHLLDDYKTDIERMPCDAISDILAAFGGDTEQSDAPVYGEREKVTVCGMITAKTVKNTRNGAQMAFLTLEDRYAEIEVIVFPKQLEAFGDRLLNDSAVRIKGSLTEREDEGVKLLLSSAELLRTNAEMQAGDAPPKAEPTAEKSTAARLYLRVPSLDAPVTREAIEILRFAPGDVTVLFFDAGTRKTVVPKNTQTKVSELLLGALRALLGAENVVLKQENETEKENKK